jgi:hypothetical protein
MAVLGPPAHASDRLFAAPAGIFLLADLSGFTAYLAGVELDHAHGVLRDLLEAVIARLAPPLIVAGLEGDGVFAYAPATALPRGETLLEAVEAAYAAFRARQESITRRTTCVCRACRAVPTLDLKFMAHAGAFLPQAISAAPGPSAPLGPAADLVRQRALKLPEAAVGRGYALFTAACLRQLGLSPAALGLVAQPVSLAIARPLQAYVLDLHASHAANLAGRRAFVAAAGADGVISQVLPAPPPVVWEWLNDPAHRSRWMAGRAWHAGQRPGGRTGPGARNHCDHGFGGITETILDWRPFDYFTVELATTGGRATVRQTYQLEPLPDGVTRLHDRFVFSPPLPRWLARPLGRLAARTLVKTDLMRLARLLTAPQSL